MSDVPCKICLEREAAICEICHYDADKDIRRVNLIIKENKQLQQKIAELEKELKYGGADLDLLKYNKQLEQEKQQLKSALKEIFNFCNGGYESQYDCVYIIEKIKEIAQKAND